MPLRDLTIILLAGVLTAGNAAAQPVQVTLWTPEAKVGQADTVVVGAIAKVSRRVIIPEGGRTKDGSPDPNGRTEYVLTVKVDEALKGDAKETVDDLRSETFGFDKRYEEWWKAGTRCLWFLGAPPRAGGPRSWEVLPLGKPVEAEGLFGGRRVPPMFSLDFTVLKDAEAILARSRAFAKAHPKRLPTHVIRIPPVIGRQCGAGGPLDDLVVPVEPSLEGRARRLIASPQDFLPSGEKLDPYERHVLRLGGVNSLRYFKSDANASLLRGLLDDGLSGVAKRPDPVYSVRTKAFEVLLHFGLAPPLPKAPEQITSLDLSATGVTDAGLKQVAKLSSLATLELQGTKVTDRGLKELAGLKNLTTLGLSESQLSDTTLRALREIGLLHVLSEASAPKGERPKSADDVGSLALCRTPVTDAGLKELVELKNLTWLDLRESRVTDVGLKELAGLKHLTRLLLQDTRVTAAGIAELRTALPNCRIDHSRGTGF
jgi:hypothetical protein